MVVSIMCVLFKKGNFYSLKENEGVISFLNSKQIQNYISVFQIYQRNKLFSTNTF